jgi:poly[(R)-3-hydroxyalkanoate] polymerase subunit PhaC
MHRFLYKVGRRSLSEIAARTREHAGRWSRETTLPKDGPTKPGETLSNEAEAAAHLWIDIAERSRKVMGEYLERMASGGNTGMAENLRIGQAFLEAMTRLWTDPVKLVQAQMSLWQQYADLWQRTAERMTGGPSEPLVKHEPGDRRFKHSGWEENHVFDFMKQSYLLTSRWLHDVVRDVEGLDEKTARKVEFYTRQWIDAVSPSNFLLTNPEVLEATIESHGENLVRGLQNLLADFERGEGRLDIKTVKHEMFEVGKNLATTPGKVIYQNALMQLLQYAPSTETVRKRPLLIVPPWINKFYILDLRPENSFIRWAVGEGFTVFIVSWVNPDAVLAKKTFEDYMLEGPLAALDAIEQATGERDITAIGYCIGGTLMAATLARMATRGDDRIRAITFFTTLTDFEDAGDLEVFIDEEQLKELEAKMEERGYLRGSEMASTFSMLRANDLIWNYVVNNYLLGKEPFPFDILYWNSDATRMPAAMHSFYLRKMYMENKLVEPGGLTLAGVPIDLGKVTIPVNIQSTREDHIAPWKTTYKATQLFKGPTRFVLSLSGHVAGVVNPPAAKRYGYWTNPETPPDPEAWLAAAEKHDGSWWPDWSAWNAKHAGALVPARTPGDGKLEPIEDAPGSYVLVKDK